LVWLLYGPIINVAISIHNSKTAVFDYVLMMLTVRFSSLKKNLYYNHPMFIK
jgi:hypothetical protein